MRASRTERRVGVAVVVVMALILIMTSIFGASPREPREGSIDSAEKNGRRALFLTLSELGFAPIPWVEAPSTLPRGPHVLWLSAVPTEDLPGVRKSLDPEKKRTQRIGQHALEHYKNFVEAGGTLIVPAREGIHEFLVDALGFEACDNVTRDEQASARECEVRTTSGEILKIDVTHGAVFEPLDFNSSARALWSVVEKDHELPFKDRELPFVVTVPEGAGSIVLIADDAFLANDTIGQKDHALAAVRLVEELAGGGRLYLDEYELGAWRPQSMYAVAVAPKLVLVTLHLGLLLALFVWMVAFARGFPRDPEPLELHSPLLRARAQSALLERAGRVSILVAFLRRGVFDRLAERARVAAPRDAQQARAVDAAEKGEKSSTHDARDADAARTQLETAQIEAIALPVTRAEVERLATAVGANELVDRLAHVFVERRVRTVQELDRLDLDLRSLESEIEMRVTGRSRTARNNSAVAQSFPAVAQSLPAVAQSLPAGAQSLPAGAQSLPAGTESN